MRQEHRPTVCDGTEKRAQGTFEKALFILPPDEKGIVVKAGIEIHSAINVILRKGRGADHHVFFRQVIRLSRVVYTPGSDSDSPAGIGRGLWRRECHRC